LAVANWRSIGEMVLGAIDAVAEAEEAEAREVTWRDNGNGNGNGGVARRGRGRGRDAAARRADRSRSILTDTVCLLSLAESLLQYAQTSLPAATGAHCWRLRAHKKPHGVTGGPHPHTAHHTHTPQLDVIIGPFTPEKHSRPNWPQIPEDIPATPIFFPSDPVARRLIRTALLRCV
jgi:hypothetical protein